MPSGKAVKLPKTTGAFTLPYISVSRKDADLRVYLNLGQNGRLEQDDRQVTRGDPEAAETAEVFLLLSAISLCSAVENHSHWRTCSLFDKSPLRQYHPPALALLTFEC
jgi:hypothetical protein